MGSASSFADGHKVKVGMITTLSGGGSGLGIDVQRWLYASCKRK